MNYPAYSHDYLLSLVRETIATVNITVKKFSIVLLNNKDQQLKPMK